jgi:hypothetical protein
MSRCFERPRLMRPVSHADRLLSDPEQFRQPFLVQVQMLARDRTAAVPARLPGGSTAAPCPRAFSAPLPPAIDASPETRRQPGRRLQSALPVAQKAAPRRADAGSGPMSARSPPDPSRRSGGCAADARRARRTSTRASDRHPAVVRRPADGRSRSDRRPGPPLVGVGEAQS